MQNSSCCACFMYVWILVLYARYARKPYPSRKFKPKLRSKSPTHRVPHDGLTGKWELHEVARSDARCFSAVVRVPGFGRLG